MAVISRIFKAITGPIGALEEWAYEPLKRWEHKRQEDSKDKDVERKIREQTGVEEVRARLQKEAASHQAELEIRMQTEINKLNVETEQWRKDKEFERMQKVVEAVAEYKERLTNLQINTVRAIGEMDIELRSKAQALIIEKTKEYKLLQDQASQDLEEELERIQIKFGANERLFEIMVTKCDQKAANIITSTGRFLEELNKDIQNMNSNLDRLIEAGHSHTLKQLDKFNNVSSPGMLPEFKNNVQEIDYREVSEQ